MNRIVGIKLLVLIFLLSLFLSSGCAGPPKRPLIDVNVDTLSPEQLVETYYKSLSNRDFKLAEKCLSDEMKEKISSTDSDFKNLKSLKNLVVTPAQPIKLQGKNFKEVQVVATYDARYKEVFSVMDGPQMWFLYVAKAGPDSPWRIISIGTGP